MLNLLVGCRVVVNHEDGKAEAVIVNVDRNGSGERCVWVVFEDGTPASYVYNDKLQIHTDDTKFLMQMSKDYKLRRKLLTDSTDRFEIMDL